MLRLRRRRRHHGCVYSRGQLASGSRHLLVVAARARSTAPTPLLTPRLLRQVSEVDPLRWQVAFRALPRRMLGATALGAPVARTPLASRLAILPIALSLATRIWAVRRSVLAGVPAPRALRMCSARRARARLLAESALAAGVDPTHCLRRDRFFRCLPGLALATFACALERRLELLQS